MNIIELFLSLFVFVLIYCAIHLSIQCLIDSRYWHYLRYKLIAFVLAIGCSSAIYIIFKNLEAVAKFLTTDLW